MSTTTLPVPLGDSHRAALRDPVNCWLGSHVEEFDVGTVAQFDEGLGRVQAIGRVWHAINDGDLTIDEPIRQLLTEWRDDYYGGCVADWEGDPSQLGDDYEAVISQTRARIAALDELLRR